MRQIPSPPVPASQCIEADYGFAFAHTLKRASICCVLFALMLQPQAYAAPLPAGTVLTISPGAGSTTNTPCTSGSCIGVEIAPGIDLWSNISPGTDGGIIIGKDQASGGQETGPSSSNSTPGEITAAWIAIYQEYSTLHSTPGGANNYFDDASCNGANCINKTALLNLFWAWNGINTNVGSANGCQHTNCTTDQLAGIFVSNWTVNPDNTYSLDYSMTAPSTDVLGGVKFYIHLEGDIQPPPMSNTPPTAEDIHLLVGGNCTGDPINVIYIPLVNDSDNGPYPLSCFISSPALGEATIASDCSSGTYSSKEWFDSFSYYASDGADNSNIATVTIEVLPAPCQPCDAMYPLSSITSTGGGQNAAINEQVKLNFIGHFTTTAGLATGSRNKVSVCRESVVEFNASSTKGNVACKINNMLVGESGILIPGDKLLCSNKPDGNDTDRFRVIGY